MSTPCKDCHNEVPISWNHCPHCARPGLFPNVKVAQMPAERDALERRYKKAKRNGSSRDAGVVIDKFEEATVTSKAVIARPFRDLDRLAASDQELYSTYYKLLGAEVRLPHGNQWDSLRRIADEVLFPGYKEEIRFAALALDGIGLNSYGECSLVMRDDMIAHRASVYEENSTIYLEHHRYKAPVGFRATWGERGKLCVAKLAGKVSPSTPEDQFSEILLRPGPTPQDDSFVEVHIWGPISLRTVERVFMTAPRTKAFLKALRERLKNFEVTLEQIA